MNFDFLDKNLNLNGVVNKYIKGAGTKDADFLTRTIFEKGRKPKSLEIDHIANSSGFGQGTQETLNQAWTDEMTEGKNFSGDVTSMKTFFAELDEPTYLTFKIAFGGPFTPVEPLHIASYAYKDMETYAGNMLKTGNMDHFPHPLLVSPAYDIEGFRGRRRHVEGTYSTYSYLLDSNNGRRAVMLYEFQKGLHELQSKYQFYFQSISGLGKLLTTSMDGQRVKKDAVIKIKCLNSIDQKVKYLLQLYKQICYDEMYQRWILPDMMRYFKLYIYISEVKRFHGTDRIVNADGPVHHELGGDSSDIGGALEEGVLRAMNSIAPVTCIECSMCEFDITQSLYDDNYSINPEEPHSGLEIPIKVGKVTIHERYPIFADVIVPVTKDFIDEYIINFRDRNLDNARTTDMTNAARDLGLIDTEYFNSTPADHKEGKLHQTGGKRVSKWVYNLMRWGVAKGNKELTDFVNKWLLHPIKNGVNVLDLENAFNSKDAVILFGTLKKMIKGTTKDYQVPDDIKDTIFKDTIKFLASNKGDNATNELADMAKNVLKDQKLYDRIDGLSDEELLNKIVESNKMASNKPEDFNLSKTDIDDSHLKFDLPKPDLNDGKKEFELSELNLNIEKKPMNLPGPIKDLFKKNIGLSKPYLNLDKDDIDLVHIEPDDNKTFDMPSIETDVRSGFDMHGIDPDERDDFDMYGIDPDTRDGFDMYGIDPDIRTNFELFGVEPDNREGFELFGPDDTTPRETFEMTKGDKDTIREPFELINSDKDTDIPEFNMTEGDKHTEHIPFELINSDKDTDIPKFKMTEGDKHTEKLSFNLVGVDDTNKQPSFELTNVKDDSFGSHTDTLNFGQDNVLKDNLVKIEQSNDIDKFDMVSNYDNTDKIEFELASNVQRVDKESFELSSSKQNTTIDKFDMPANKQKVKLDKFDMPDNKTVDEIKAFNLPSNKQSDKFDKFDMPSIDSDIDLDALKHEFKTIFNRFNSGPNPKVKPFDMKRVDGNTDKEKIKFAKTDNNTDVKSMNLAEQRSTGEKEDMKLQENKQKSDHVHWEMDRMGNVTVVDPVDISKNKYDK